MFFIPQNQARRIGTLAFCDVHLCFFAESDAFEAALSHVAQGLGDIGDTGDRKAQQGS